MTLPYTREESERAHKEWGANCGPHALAAGTRKSLAKVRAALKGFRGWTNPTLMGEALLNLGVYHQVDKRFPPNQRLRRGIARIQWEGPWLDKGVPPAVAYRYTHWIASTGKEVLDTMIDPYRWLPEETWKIKLEEEIKSDYKGWHFTHWYQWHS